MNNLEYVIAITENTNLQRAAHKLHISPSALSQHVSKLENELNAPLFTRSKSGWSPTPAGEIFIDMARKVLELERQALEDICQLTDSYANEISIGVSSGRMTEMFSATFPAFNSKYPHVKLTLTNASGPRLIEMLQQQTLDIGFIASSFEILGLSVQLLSREQFLLVVPRSHPLLRAPKETTLTPYTTVPLEHFKDCEFVLSGKDTTLYMAEKAIFKDAGFAPNVIFESSNIQTIRALSNSGYALSILPESYVTVSPETVFFYLDTPYQLNRYAVSNPRHKLSIPENYIISLAIDWFKRPALPSV